MKAKIGISIAFLALILIPTLLVFRSFFFPGSLAWGDAPHFYQEGLKELMSEPLAWVDRGVSFGGVNNFVFIWPLMFLYGIIRNNDIAIRLLFYIYSLGLAGFGTYFLTKYLKLSKSAQFFAVLAYLLNTYYLLLIDGGQVGVALAYGIFPFALLNLKKIVDNLSIKTFYLSLIFLLLLSIADPRVALISAITIVVWSVSELKVWNLVYLIPLGIASFGINMYWIFPLFKNEMARLVGTGPLSVRWYDPFLLFSPHWPQNLFGTVSRPPVYFLGVPLLIFGVLLFNRSKQIIGLVLSFLVFAILSLGIPFIDKIPFGFTLRDSTKFYTPLILFAAILIGATIEAISEKLRMRKFVYYLLLTACYIYLLFLISPALFGKMNFVLSNRQAGNDFQKIYENIRPEKGFVRSAWFPERHPLAYETSDHPALDARDIAHFFPFAHMNAGEDVFNFLNDNNFVDWFRILGIKYLIMSDNPREITKTEKDQKDWNIIQELVASNKQLARVEWGTQIPIYKINNTYPRFYVVKQLAGVIGPPLVSNIYSPSIYFEDGKWDPHLLEGKNANSLVLVFNGGDKTDLVMSFLQKYFVSGKEASKNEWASYTSEEYLKYKYELLIRGVKFNDFDYSRGISFSTKKGEKMEFKFNVLGGGVYVLALRTMKPINNETILNWKTKEMALSKGIHTEVLENDTGLTIFNTIALVPKKDFDNAVKLADTFTKYFKVVEISNLKLEAGYSEVKMENGGTLKYKFEMPKDNFWLIFTDNYNPLWKVKQGDEYHDSVPVYSMVNGFYAEDKWSKLGIEFRGQENVRWGLYWSTISVFILSIIYLWKSSNNENSKNN